MNTDLIMDALSVALARQDIVCDQLITHSDRGSQYASESSEAIFKISGSLPACRERETAGTMLMSKASSVL